MRKMHNDREIVPVMIVGKGRGARIGARYKDDEFSVVKDAEGLAIPFRSLWCGSLWDGVCGWECLCGQYGGWSTAKNDSFNSLITVENDSFSNLRLLYFKKWFIKYDYPLANV